MALLLFGLAAPAAAQAPAPQVEAIEACLAAAERDPAAERACVGAQALACIDARADAQTTAGMSACFAAEAEAWEAVMGAAYGDLAGLMRAAGADPDPAVPDPQERLLAAAQDAWAAFRDADCAQEVAVWGDGSMRSVAAAQCRLERTAARTLELTAKRRAFESP